MSDPIRIRCRENGSLVVEGPVVIVDHLGNPYPLPTNKPNVALCRCGVSASKPFCDGSHRTSGFVADNPAPLPTAPPASDA
jgi:CDGSH-type Zn-finger protein